MTPGNSGRMMWGVERTKVKAILTYHGGGVAPLTVLGRVS